MCLPTPGLNIFLGAAVVVKRLPRYVKSVTRSMTSLPQVMPPMFSGYRFLISLILDAFTLSQTMVACFRSPSHVCDLLAQQNQIVGEVHVFQLLQQGELDPGLVVTKGLSGSLFMELMHGCWENLLCVWYLVVLHLDLRTLSVAASQILPTRVNNLTIYWRAVYDRLTSHPGGVLLLPFVHSFGNQSAVSWFISRRCRFIVLCLQCSMLLVVISSLRICSLMRQLNEEESHARCATFVKVCDFHCLFHSSTNSQCW